MRVQLLTSLILLLATSSCQRQDEPVRYEAVAIDRVCDRDRQGALLHRYVQVEGYLSMPQKIFTLYGGGTSVTLYEGSEGGRRVETNIKVGKTGASRLIRKADMYDEKTLKIADQDGTLLSFSEPVVIRGELRSDVRTPSECYIEVSEIGRGSPR